MAGMPCCCQTSSSSSSISSSSQSESSSPSSSSLSSSSSIESSSSSVSSLSSSSQSSSSSSSSSESFIGCCESTEPTGSGIFDGQVLILECELLDPPGFCECSWIWSESSGTWTLIGTDCGEGGGGGPV